SEAKIDDKRRTSQVVGGAPIDHEIRRQSPLISIGTTMAIPWTSRGSTVRTVELRCSVRRAQPIADARFGQDVARTLGVGFDLLPELPDIDPQVLRIGEVVP